MPLVDEQSLDGYNNHIDQNFHHGAPMITRLEGFLRERTEQKKTAMGRVLWMGSALVSTGVGLQFAVLSGSLVPSCSSSQKSTRDMGPSAASITTTRCPLLGAMKCPNTAALTKHNSRSIPLPSVP